MSNASGKRAGKQRARDRPPNTSTVDNVAAKLTSFSNDPKGTPNTRQKRVLPSRSRRGGPGIGSCDVDVMILDAHKRKFENEPLIPADTKFLLTTNSALTPSSSPASFEIQLNSQAYERYFDRPEVIEAYREQQTIQTPEFSLLSEDASVGSRFRPRGSEDELADTSDAAYEKRHRKYETFEKRQRLREKEKLKHEQYKLKERIDQLRAMDASAFLSLPPSSFAPLDDQATKVADDETGSANGAAAHAEGERRRKEMLDVARILEERYNLLLPPDRKWMEKNKGSTRQKSISFSAELEPESESGTSSEQEPEPEPEPEVVEMEQEEEEEDGQDKEQTDDGESEIDVEERRAARRSPEKIKLKIKLRPSEVASATALRKLVSSSSVSGSPIHHSTSYPSFALDSDAGSSISTHLSGKQRGSDGRFMPHKKAKVHVYDEIEEPSRKVGRRLSARSPDKAWSQSDVAYNTPDASMSKSASSRLDRGSTCILLATAQRNAGEPNVRKTQRHLTAFGLKVPFEVEEFRDFELPYWLRPEYESEEEEEEEEFHVASHSNGLVQNGNSGAAHGDQPDMTMDWTTYSEVPEVDVTFKGG